MVGQDLGGSPDKDKDFREDFQAQVAEDFRGAWEADFQEVAQVVAQEQDT